jgi:three-Cys-motif partner protein
MTSRRRAKRHQNHHWTKDGALPERLQHSIAKHRVIRAYLERYVETLTTNLAQSQLKLSLIDGFAGGGMYAGEHSGSPLIMLEAMQEAERIAQSKRKNPFELDVEYFFVEKNLGAFERLQKELNESEFRHVVGSHAQLLHGDFLTHYRAIVERIASRSRSQRAIFLLDQFGYSDVPLPAIREILEKLENAEVILTFATDFLISYLNGSEKDQARLASMGIFLPPNLVTEAKRSPDWKRIIQFALHEEIPFRTGAKYYTPFFIRSLDSGRDYWLIHLSGHSRARDVMVELHWKESSCFEHFGRSGLRMLGYDQTQDPTWTNQPLFDGFQFDSEARKSSERELAGQLPHRVSLFKEGIPFVEFFSKHTNETPATSLIIRDVINQLVTEGDVEVLDRDGKRRTKITKNSDIIRPSQQRKLFLPHDFV